MKNVVFWYITPCDSLRTEVSEERIASIIRVTRVDDVFLQCASVASLNIDYKLYWKSHINHLVTKLSLSCFIMRTIKTYHVIKELENDLFCLYTFCHDIWNYFGG
jgi:hypothetical protein